MDEEAATLQWMNALEQELNSPANKERHRLFAQWYREVVVRLVLPVSGK